MISGGAARILRHINDVNHICDGAERHGFEFKLKKAQLHQPELELWGCVCGKFGRKPQVKKIVQLEKLAGAHLFGCCEFVLMFRELPAGVHACGVCEV